MFTMGLFMVVIITEKQLEKQAMPTEVPTHLN